MEVGVGEAVRRLSGRLYRCSRVRAPLFHEGQTLTEYPVRSSPPTPCGARVYRISQYRLASSMNLGGSQPMVFHDRMRPWVVNVRASSGTSVSMPIC